MRTTFTHLLFLFLLAVTPAWDYYDTRRLKQDPSSARKIGYYKTLCLWLWAATIAACILVGFRSIFTTAPMAEEATWLFRNIWIRYVVLMAICVLAAFVLLPYVIVAWKRVAGKPRRYASADLLKKMSYAYLFPATVRERRWWVVVALTAGICEEVLFRGFVLRYLHTAPWRLSLTVALLISAVTFGLQHLYQGIGGSAGAAAVGALFGLLFLLTGSLVFPIVLHAAMDLRMLVILRPAVE